MLEPLTCPQCGAPLRAGADKCDYCGTEFAREDGRRTVLQADFDNINIEFVEKTIAKHVAAIIERPDNPSGGPCGAGGKGCSGRAKAVVYAYNRPILEVDE